MPRLTRVHQKVFASNASNNGVFGSLQAGNPQTSNDVATLQSLSAFENGWDDAIEQGDKLPPLEEFQGIQYGISYQQAYMLQEGIAEWNASTPYYKGSLVKTISGSSFKLYCSLADNNTNNVVTNTTYWKLVMDSDNLYAYDSDVVHTTGNEYIAGTKTFLSDLYVSHSGAPAFITKENDITKGTAPSSEQYQGFYCYDSAGNVMSRLRHRYATNKNNFTDIIVYKANAESDTENASISLAYPATGNPYATCPTPDMTTATNSTRIATTGWVNSIGNNVVHKTDNEIIAGTKTFSSTISGSITGNAGTVTNGVYTNTAQTISGNKTFTGTVTLNGSVSAATSTKKTISGWAIPDYTTASETSLGNITSGHRFTPTQDGTLHVQVQGTYVEVHISLVRTNDTLELVGAKDSDSGVAEKTVWIPVKAGQTYEITGRGSTKFYAFFCALTAAG